MVCRSCNFIQWNALNFTNEEDWTPRIAWCCEQIPDIPYVTYQETPEETLRMFAGECKMVDLECNSIKNDNRRYFTKGCAKCSSFQPGYYFNDGFVHYVNFSMYPSPCQCHCIYCNVHETDQSTDTESAKKLYEHIFSIVDLALERGLIVKNASWQVSTGEISIHPYHDRIMKYVKGKPTSFFTNCIKFDEDIAQNLHDNPRSCIFFSIDSGIPETWHKVKGLNNFDKAIETLSKYHVRATHPEQIILKYIILPGINDTYEDFISIAEIMKTLNLKKLTIARDFRSYGKLTEQDMVNLMGAASYLVAILLKNDMSADMLAYLPEERQVVIDQAHEILDKGLI